MRDTAAGGRTRRRRGPLLAGGGGVGADQPFVEEEMPKRIALLLALLLITGLIGTLIAAPAVP